MSPRSTSDPVAPGASVFGLRRAFRVAGAGGLIMSLRSVEDESTRRWMKALYEGRLEPGLDTAEAVRAASVAVMAQRRKAGLSAHPFCWPAFVAAGDWEIARVARYVPTPIDKAGQFRSWCGDCWFG